MHTAPGGLLGSEVKVHHGQGKYHTDLGHGGVPQRIYYLYYHYYPYYYSNDEKDFAVPFAWCMMLGRSNGASRGAQWLEEDVCVVCVLGVLCE